MKIRAEMFGTKIGVDNNLVEAMKSRKVGILLTLRGDDGESKTELVLNKSEAHSLIEQMNTALNAAKKLGFDLYEE